MGWYPEAVKKPLQTRLANRRRPMPNPTRINLHTAVSNGSSLKTFWDSQGVFSHFYVRQDGVVEQYQDTIYRSACDLDGNPDTISIESWDGATYPTRPWTDAQMASLAKLLQWIWEEHPTIPKKLATNNRRGIASQGLSWHQLGVPYDKRPGYAMYKPEEGGLYYTYARGKECPGKARISQIQSLYRAASRIDAPKPEPIKQEEDDMPYTPEQLQNIVRGAIIGMLETPRYNEYADENQDGKRNTRSIADILYSTHAAAVNSSKALVKLSTAVGQIENVDENEVATQIVSLLRPVIEASVREVLKDVNLSDAFTVDEISVAVANETARRMAE